MTQAEFAVLVLKTAVTTIARYETSHPPEGDLLRRLWEAAEQHKLYELRDRFKELFAENALTTLGFDLMSIPKTDAEVEHAILMKRVYGALAIQLAQSFLIVADALNSELESTKATALDALAAMQKAASILGGPAITNLQRAIAAGLPQAPTTTTTTPKPRKRRK